MTAANKRVDFHRSGKQERWGKVTSVHKLLLKLLFEHEEPHTLSLSLSLTLPDMPARIH